MTQPIPDYLRLLDLTADFTLADGQDFASLVRLCEAFEHATGWTLQYEPGPDRPQNPNLVWSAPVDPGVGASLGLIRPGFMSPAQADTAVPLERAVAVAEALVQVWCETAALREAVCSREAQLMADLPVVARREAPDKTAQRFAAILKAGADAVGCRAAALYLLDAATTTLKLRAVWGLSKQKLIEPARELAGALGDLEALLGHAVVLSEPAMIDYWHAPEIAAAAVCVPVSSATTPLGTLWLFSDVARDFDDRETNLIEVVAGRLASELEREVLLDDARLSQSRRREVIAAAERQTESLPRVGPLLERWQVAGRLITAAVDGDFPLANAFFDWFQTAERATVVSLGTADETGFGGAVVAAEMRSTLRTQADRLTEVDRALVTAHEVLTSLSAGSHGASLFCALLPAGCRRGAKPRKRATSAGEEVRFAAAGNIHALVVSPAGCRLLAQPTERLVIAGSPNWSEIRTQLNPGEVLLVYTTAAHADDWLAADGGPGRVAELLLPALPDDAERFADAAAAAIADLTTTAGKTADGALLVIRAM